MFKIPVQHEKHHVTKVSDSDGANLEELRYDYSSNQLLHFQNLFQYLLEWKRDLLSVFTNMGQVYVCVCPGSDSGVPWQLAHALTEPLSFSPPTSSLP